MTAAFKEAISGNSTVAGTPSIIAPGASPAVEFSEVAAKTRNLPLTRQTALRWTDNDVREQQE
jgi:hypothetical protein